MVLSGSILEAARAVLGPRHPPLPFCSGAGSSGLLTHIIDHPLFDEPLFSIGGLPVYFTKHSLMLILAALLTAVCFVPLAAFLSRKSDAGPKGRFVNLLESFVVFMRDEVIGPNLGHHKETFLPFFLTLFHFILFCNLLGMIPGAGAATGNLGVTGTLAVITLLVGTIGGMVIQRPLQFVKNLVPHGIPWPVLILLYPLEIVGLLVKHMALALRLFANMIAGHIVLGSLVMLIFMFKSLAIAPGPILMGVALSGLELFVAFLQAYIFVLLGSLFVGMAVCPEH
jgi:F-type H+-transporting ATPase subunit a